MQVTLDDAQTFIIEYLKNPSVFSRMQGELRSFGYELYLSNVIKAYINKSRSVSGQKPMDYHELESLIPTLSSVFMDAAWNLCLRGMLRQGTISLGQQGTSEGRDGTGFSVTSYGRTWLAEINPLTLISADPFHLTQLLGQFQPRFGSTYFKRAQEAVRCFKAGVYLACCAMSGAAAESILLQLAFAIKTPEQVLKIYFASSGRRNVENLIFGKTIGYIRDRYQRYTDLINYWRNESAHGNQSEIDLHHAYEALTALIMFAHFVNDHWDEITHQVKTQNINEGKEGAL